MMWDVIITYDYGNPAIPKGYECTTGGTRPKCNHRVVGQANSQSEGLAIGKDIFDQEIAALSWLINDPILNQMETEVIEDRASIDQWRNAMEKEYQARRDALHQKYESTVQARREELMRERGLKTD